MTISNAINAAASFRHHADIAVAEQAEAGGAASKNTLTKTDRAVREATLATTAARQSLQAARANLLLTLPIVSAPTVEQSTVPGVLAGGQPFAASAETLPTAPIASDPAAEQPTAPVPQL